MKELINYSKSDNKTLINHILSSIKTNGRIIAIWEMNHSDSINMIVKKRKRLTLIVSGSLQDISETDLYDHGGERGGSQFELRISE